MLIWVHKVVLHKKYVVYKAYCIANTEMCRSMQKMIEKHHEIVSRKNSENSSYSILNGTFFDAFFVHSNI